MKLILIMVMAIAINNEVERVADADTAFYRVDTFKPAHELQPGECADAVNKRFEDGRAWPRFGVNQQPWGKTLWNAGIWKVCGFGRFNDPQGFDTMTLATDDWRDGAAFTGSLNTGRSQATATLLQNGKVLVVGGVIAGGAGEASVELYDPTSGMWQVTGSLHYGRYDHTATLLLNGKVLVTGGQQISIDSTAELYDPATGTWSDTGSLHYGRYGHTATLIGSKVLIAGGIHTSYRAVAELYNPATGTWSDTGSLNTVRKYHPAVLLVNGKMLVAGGENITGALHSAELYDPVAGTWANTGSLNTARKYHSLTLLANGQVLAGGGSNPPYDPIASAELYDPVAGTWANTGSLNTARKYHTAVLLSNSKVFVVGGRGNTGYLASSELYDPVAGTWSNAVILSTPRLYNTITLLRDGNVLIAGGVWFTSCELLLTDANEDGGRGRLWKIVPGNAPEQISLNGHDVWAASYFVPCYNGLTLLRPDPERHYFPASAVSATSQIQLNCAPSWENGDKVQFCPDLTVGSYFIDTAGTPNPPNANSQYYVKNITGNKIELYSDASLTTQMTWTSALGRFYIERQADFPGFFGNGSPPLIAQPSEIGNTLWDMGFVAFPDRVDIIGTDTTTMIASAPNHRLLPADAVTVSGIHTTGSVLITTCYACPVSDHALRFYSTASGALAGGATGLIPLVNANETGTVTKSGASGLAMPSGRAGIYYQSRLVIVNRDDTLAISDPMDPLHCSPFQGALSANLGESDPIQSLAPFGNDSILIEKKSSILLLENFSAGPSGWRLTSVTREYGNIAPLSGDQTGTDYWSLSRKGVVSIAETELGVVQGVAEPISKPMKKYIEMIDWNFARQSAGKYWNNRFFLAVPLKGQVHSPQSTVKNNGVLVYNFLNKGWEGLWSGAALEVFAWAHCTVFGEERLCFLNYDGQVCWLGDGFTDEAAAIVDKLVTRRYTGGNTARKLWLTANLIFDALAPSLTVTALLPGYNDESALTSGKTYDATKYLVYGQPDYDPATSTAETFDAPRRQDYAVSAEELLAGKLDVHQNHPLPLRLRLDGWGVQLQIENASGSARLQSVELGANQRKIMPRT